MFERIRLQNFQAHRRLDVVLDPHVTTIVGPSDVGKSALVRALRWVCTNQPDGQAFIRTGAKGCTVRLWVDGHTVTRKRGKSTNTYQVDDGPVLKAFGRGVPDPVQDLLQLATSAWQAQHDAPFWFGLPPGQVSQALNAIIDLSCIDNALKQAGTAVARARVAADVAADNLTAAVQRRKALAWVPKAADQWQAVQDAQQAAQDAQDDAQALRGLVTTAQQAQATVDAWDPVVTLAATAVQDYHKARAATKRRQRLTKAIDDAQAAQAALDAPDLPDGWLQAYDAQQAAQAQADQLRGLVQTATQAQTQLCQAKQALKAAAADAPDVCPTCGRPPARS